MLQNVLDGGWSVSVWSAAGACFPSRFEWVVGGPPAFVWAWCCLTFSGWLKQRWNLRTGYTRKTFHILIFLAATAVQMAVGLPMVCVFGAAVSLVIFYALARGRNFPGYEALAREQDEPHRTYYILAPYAATLLGGLASTVLFGPHAVVGLLVTGLGDAIGEPIGVRFGRHAYRVPAWGGVHSSRTLEGSVAVFLVSLFAVVAGVLAGPYVGSRGWLMAGCLAVAGIAATVEAFSPHGWDNFTLQVVPSGLASVLFAEG